MRRTFALIAIVGTVVGSGCGGGGMTAPTVLSIAGLPALAATNTTATVSVAGGTGPYTWSLSDPLGGTISASGTGTSATLVTGTRGGTFTVTVRDSTGASVPLGYGVGFTMTFSHPGTNSYEVMWGTVTNTTPAVFTKTSGCGVLTSACVGTVLPGSYALHVFDALGGGFVCSATATVNLTSSSIVSTSCNGTDAVGGYRLFQLDAAGNVS